jgi:hypothetical protein
MDGGHLDCRVDVNPLEGNMIAITLAPSRQEDAAQD